MPPSRKEEESNANETVPGNVDVDGADGLAKVIVHNEDPAAVDEPAEEAPEAAGPAQAGTAPRNKRNELPAILPRPACCCEGIENAYCELGGGARQDKNSKPVRPRLNHSAVTWKRRIFY